MHVCAFLNACGFLLPQQQHLDRGGNANRFEELSERKQRHLAVCFLTRVRVEHGFQRQPQGAEALLHVILPLANGYTRVSARLHSQT